MSRIGLMRRCCGRSIVLRRNYWTCIRQMMFIIVTFAAVMGVMHLFRPRFTRTEPWLNQPGDAPVIRSSPLHIASSEKNDSLQARNNTNNPVGTLLKAPSGATFNGSVGPKTSTSPVAPQYHNHFDVDCPAIVQGNTAAIRSAARTLRMAQYRLPNNHEVQEWTRNCDLYRKGRNFPTAPLSQEVAEFPIAYIIVTHTDSSQTERLLRAIYQPQNVYCIHPDKKSPQGFQEAMRSLAACFPNVFLVSEPVRVNYAHSSRLQADVNCMRDLLKRSEPWKYVINLCGLDFPIKTNLEIVRMLKDLKGHNDIPGVVAPDWFDHRTRIHHEFRNGQMVKLKEVKKPPPPRDFKFYFGNAYYAATQGFADYVIHNQTAVDLLKYSNDTYSPDEHYWVTLHRIPGIPGGVVGSSWESSVRFVKWKGTTKFPECVGKYVRNICIFGAGYVQHLKSSKKLFANKFHMSYDPIAMQCVEALLDYRTRHPDSETDFA